MLVHEFGRQSRKANMAKPNELVVKLRQNSTGEIVDYAHKDNGEFNDFMWSDLNYACDCNRSNFFYRAKGEEIIHSPCGDTEYTVLSIKNAAGDLLYTEVDDGKTET